MARFGRSFPVPHRFSKTLSVGLNGGGLVVGSFTLTGAGTVTYPGTGTVSGSFSLTGAGSVTYNGAGSIVGSFAFSGAGILTTGGQGSLSGSFNLKGVGTYTGPGTIYVQGPISSRWLPAMEAQVLTVFTYADIWQSINGVKLLSQVPVIAGTVNVDRNNAIRRRVSNLTFLPDAAGLLMPIVGGTGLLYPTGVEIQLYKGCVYEDGSAEVASLGRFLLEETDVISDQTGVTLVGTLQDRGYTISRAKFTSPYTTDGVSTLDVVIKAILTTGINNQVAGIANLCNFTPSTFVPSIQTFNIGDDPWQGVQTLAASGGMEIFPDKNGVLVLQNIVDPITVTPCAIYLEGSWAAPTSIKRTIANTSVPNVIVGISSGSGVATPLQTYWWDNTPTSITYYASGVPGTTLPVRSGASVYPTLVQTFNTTAATTLAQLQQMVNSLGLSYIGTLEGAVISIRDNPAHDVNDVVTLQRVVGGIPFPTNYIVDQVAIDLGTNNPLQLTTRQVVN